MRWFAAAMVALYVNLLVASPASAKPKKRPKAPQQALLEVTATVPGATVLLNDVVIGETPVRNKPMREKSATVTVRKLGYLEFKQKVTFKVGETTRLTADLLPFAGVIHVTSNRTGAQVAVDGKVVGTVPLYYEIRLGTHQVTVTASGFQTFTQSVRANPGEVYELRAAFGSKPGQIAALPLGVEPLPPPPAKTDGGVALVPLEAPPREPSLELPLEPMGAPALVPPLVAPGSGSGEVALELLPGTEPAPQLEGPFALGTRTQVPPAKPWYRQWWAYAAAGGVVAAGVVTAVVIAKSHGGDKGPQFDAVWSPP